MTDASLYRAPITVRCDVQAGGATLELDLVVDASKGVVYGGGRITQAVTPGGGDLPIHNISGRIRHTGLGQDQLLVALEGEYGIPGPPGTIAISTGKLTAALAVDRQWNGDGMFTYGVDGRQSCPKATVTNRD
jgi:hypothetical protein